MKNRTLISLALTLLVGLSGAACRSVKVTDPHRPGPITVSTRPTQALVRFPSKNLEFWTPFQLPPGISLGERVEITLEGFQPYYGRLEDLPRVAANVYELTLSR